MAKRVQPPKPGRALAKGEIPKPPRIPGQKDAAAQTGGARDPVKRWQARLTKANKQYDTWAKEFEVKRLEQYYRGKQWKGLTEEEAQKKYVENLFYATIETQLPTLLFSKPTVKVDARPDRAEGAAATDLNGRATLIQHTLQTQIDNKALHFGFLTTLALRSAYFRFGLLEVGYSADWIDNPNAGKPLLKEGTDEPMLDGTTNEPVTQAPRVRKPGTESLYFKRIPPGAFRVWPGRNLLEQNDWCAYYEWHPVSDVKDNPNYKHTANLNATGRTEDLEGDGQTPSAQHDRDADRGDHDGQVKIWKIFDLRAKQRYVLADGHTTFLEEGQAFTYLPILDLKFFELEDEYYPMPPSFTWQTLQDDINDEGDMARVHRKRAIRRYVYDASITKLEFEKLEGGEDMVAAKVPKIEPMPIQPVPDAELGEGFWKTRGATREAFAMITGVSGEARGNPEADTATQANIINVRQQVRESRARQQVADWLGRICYTMLLCIREHFQESFMVQQTIDPFHPDPAQAAETGAEWREVQKEEIADLAVDVSIDVASLSPVSMDAERAAWTVVLQLLVNPQLAMLLAIGDDVNPKSVPPLLRKTLRLYGVSSDREITEIWRVLQKYIDRQALMAMAAAAAKGGAPAGGLASLGGGNGNAPASAAPELTPGQTTTGQPTALPGVAS